MSARMHLTLGILVWAVLVTDAAAQAPALTSSAGGRIAGRVVSTHARLVADALVTLMRMDAGGAASDWQTRSDDSGAFTFERVPGGRYSISASKPGYTNRRLPSSASASSLPAQQRFETSADITLRAGERKTGVELSLRRAARIAGRIAEPDGIPAPEVEVFAALRRDTGYVLLPETRTISEWDGRYEITGLPPGEYLVVVMPIPSLDRGRALANAERRAPEAPVSTRPSFAPTLYPGVSRVDQGDAITVFEGVAAEGIDVWLTPAQRFSISGRVYWPDIVAVDNIAIEYSDLTADRSGLWFVSDPGGLFTITGVPAGTIVLLARADSDRGPLTGIASTRVNVSGVEDLRLTLETPGSVEGRVVYEAGVPASVRATSIALRQTLVPVSALYPVPESLLGADGRFQIANAFGEYAFELRDLPDGFHIKGISHRGLPIPHDRIAVAGGETITGLEVRVGK